MPISKLSFSAYTSLNLKYKGRSHSTGLALPLSLVLNIYALAFIVSLLHSKKAMSESLRGSSARLS
jgi:hypothetical protein